MTKRLWIALALTLLLAVALPLVAQAAPVSVHVFATSPGTVYYEPAKFWIHVPPRIFARNTDIRVDTPPAGSIPESEQFYASRAVEVAMTDREGQAVTGLPKPIRLAFGFDAIDHKRASRLRTEQSVGHFRVGYWDEQDQDWIALPSIVFWNGEEGLVESESDRGAGKYGLIWAYGDSSPLSPIKGDEIRIFVDFNPVRSIDPPYIVDSRIMVPLRVIAENLGTRVEWDSSEQRIDIVRNLEKIQLWVGKTEAVNLQGQTIKLDVAPEINNNRTFVPLRFIAEAFGAKVDWVALTRSALIFSP